jgi:hypothetical protein
MDTFATQAEKVYQQLTNCLEDIIKAYNLLIENLHGERAILIQSDIEKLNESNHAKETILMKLATLENIRLKIAKDLAQIIGANFEAPRLLEIAAKLPPLFGTKLKDQHAVLDLSIRRVNEINRENEELVHSALTHVQGAMNAIRDALADNKTYKKDSAINKNPKAGRLVSREA